MKKDWKYILYISAAFGLFVVVKLLSPKQYNWNVTYSHEDKNPFGAFALNELLPSLFSEKGIRHSYKTIYEMRDSLRNRENILIVCSNFSGGKEDSDVLLGHVAGGGTAFISAQYFLGHFADTLGLQTYDSFFNGGDIFKTKDSTVLKFSNISLDTTQLYFYRRDNIHNYFNRFDTTRTTVIASNDKHQPVTIRMKWGRGNFILNSTPLAFTNIYLLANKNNEFLSKTLSYLPAGPVEWTEFYHMGRMEIGTPLRFVLTNEPLRWAYYLTIAALFLFMIFEMKRKQKIIPVIEPLANTTLDFVTTIGNLYYQSAEHKNIAEKKIQFFIEQVRTRYWLNANQRDKVFIETLARKSGKPEEDVKRLMDVISAIQAKKVISKEELIEFNKQMENFNS